MIKEDGIISVVYQKNDREIRVEPVYQYDHGLFLLIKGVQDVQKMQGHFATETVKKAVNLAATQYEDGA